MENVANFNGWSRPYALERLKSQYDGYHFTPVSPDVYNPFSLLQSFDSGELKSYWFESGRSRFLWELIMTTVNSEALEKVLSPLVSINELGSTEDLGLSLPALLYQTGYLTIKGVRSRGDIYQLGIPNEEVRTGIMEDLLPLAAKKEKRLLRSDIMKLRDLADNGEVDEMMHYLKSFLAGISYRLTRKEPEIYYENNLMILFNLIGVETRVEVETSDGRMDLLLRCDGYIYVIELKLDSTAEQALIQIKQKHYSLPFEHCDLPVIGIGVNFSSKQRNIESWKWEQLYSSVENSYL